MALKGPFFLFLTLVFAAVAKPGSSFIIPPSIIPTSVVKGAYWPSSAAETLLPSDIPTSYFTHIFYAFLEPNDTSYQLVITQSDDQWMRNFTASIHAKKTPAKAFLSIGGGNSNSFTFANIVSSPENRCAFINSTISVARMYGFDGLDLDWEFPSNPQNMSNLASLFSEWHFHVKRESHFSGKQKLFLSAAVYFASHLLSTDPQTNYPAHTIKKYVDFISPMCYDYRGSWDTSETGAPALLYDKSSNISTSYGIFSWKQSGVPSKKIVMGIPMYGKTWNLKDPNEHDIGAPANGTGPGDEGIMTYEEIVNYNLENGTTVVYDNETVSTYSYVGSNWIGYDDVESVVNKVKYAKSQGLGGYFFWALGQDKNWTLSQAASRAWDG